MRASFGNDGWVGIDDVELPGPLYVRVRESTDGRLRISEIYLDGSESDTEIDTAGLRSIPFARIETLINAHRDAVVRGMRQPGPDLATLASYFRTSFGNVERQIVNDRNWVVTSFAAQYPQSSLDDAGLPRITRPRRQRRPWQVVSEEKDFRLTRGPDDGLTDEFLRNVARAYAAAVARGESPNKAIAEQVGYGANSTRSVERWVYLARQRGIMPRGKKGQVGS